MRALMRRNNTCTSITVRDQENQSITRRKERLVTNVQPPQLPGQSLFAFELVFGRTFLSMRFSSPHSSRRHPPFITKKDEKKISESASFHAVKLTT